MKAVLAAVILTARSSGTAYAADPVFLSDLDWVATRSVQSGTARVPLRDKAEREIKGGGVQYVPLSVGGHTYGKGLSIHSAYMAESASVTYWLDKRYQKLVTWLGLSDEMRGKGPSYEWGRIHPMTGEFLWIERPGGSPAPNWRGGNYNGPEGGSLVRISGGASVTFVGDKGHVLAQSEELYLDSAPVKMEVDLTGVGELTIIVSNEHKERCNTPYRKGLSPCPVVVKRCSWYNAMILGDSVLAPKDAKPSALLRAPGPRPRSARRQSKVLAAMGAFSPLGLAGRRMR